MYVSVTKMHAAPKAPGSHGPQFRAPVSSLPWSGPPGAQWPAPPFSRGASAQFTASVCSQGKLPSVT